MSLFDELAKVMARKSSRREMLGKVATILGGAVVGAFALTSKADAIPLRPTLPACQAYCTAQRFRLTSQYQQCLATCLNCHFIGALRTTAFYTVCIFRPPV